VERETVTIRHHIPVADAPLSAGRAAPAQRTAAHDGAGSLDGRARFFVGLTWLTIFCFLGIFSVSGGILQALLVVSRYLLWPLILFGAGLHIVSRGGADIGRNMAVVMPFFAIGLISAVAGFDVGTSVRMLTFWLLGVVSASVIAAELPEATVQRTLFAIMFALIGGSLVFVLLFPGIAIGADKRGLFGGGSWNGVFPGKNSLGWVAGYALIFCALVPRTSAMLRILLTVMTVICLFFSGSQGSVVIAAGTAAFVGVVWLLRRTSLSAGARALVLLTIVLIVIPVSITASNMVLELLGRDTTLTGRTDIWHAFFGRAMEYWVIGAGPGSFTTGSSVTEDLTAALTEFGSIFTPHNMFIAVFGETGIFGLLAYVSVLFYAAFVLPFRNERPIALATSAVAFTTAIGGIGETREVFGPAFAMFLLILMLSLSRKRPDLAVPPDDEASAPDPTRPLYGGALRHRVPALGKA
jgi:O-antigen ligase